MPSYPAAPIDWAAPISAGEKVTKAGLPLSSARIAGLRRGSSGMGFSFGSVFAQQPAIAGDSGVDPGEPHDVPQHRLGRAYHRLADALFDRLDRQMRAEIEAGDQQPC